MKTTIDMGIDQIIDSSILEIFPLMPSPGAWPFTMIRVDRNELANLEMDKTLFAPFQLLILKRTDFDSKDLRDYVTKSKEYQTMEEVSKKILLEKHDKIVGNENEFRDWMERTTSLAIGLVIQTAIYKGLQFTPVGTDLVALDVHLGLGKKKLQAYQLYDAYQIDPSFLA